ncbi:von willebrand factor type A (vWA) domain was originally [Brachionus plicatilis]|uniref:von willebrand factor type A (VWA) domain was originally n=1 Tax=Brachionus plicatilis TaxID=10195 RepID=A0A3M7SYI8_BRAPC|nr:von willebrand factor type A (vWA) domain was originally [Brachionus plicatilis]
MSQTPLEFLCPISQSIMIDPVNLSCGHTFDRNSVTLWTMNNSSCPTCRKTIDDQNLYTNWALKSLIDKFNNSSLSIHDLDNDKNVITDDSVDEIEIDNSTLSSIKANVSLYNDCIDLCLEVPTLKKRRPVSFVCVIDISGSMSSVVGNAEGGKAFTRLDLVKHVLNVMITSLTGSDQLALISFSDEVATELDLIPMSSQNKSLAKQIVQQLCSLNSTFTGPALQKAYKLIEKAPRNHLKSVILLTDGQDTEGSDILETKFEYIKKPDDVQLNTFGFSNDIVSVCLDRLAMKGKGIFGFIPDQSMIGTIFLNFMSNTFLSFIQNLRITLRNGHQFALESSKTKITTVQSGKQHHFLINKNEFTDLNNFKIKLAFLDSEMELKCERAQADEENFNLQLSRFMMLSILTDANFIKLDLTKYYPKFKLAEFLAEIKQTDVPDANNEQIALSLKYWNSWGQHYVRSFKFAHLFEQAINFKSPSMKSYRTERFDQLIEKLTQTFVTLPPPRPSGHAIHNSPHINMTNIMDRNNGCVLSSCLVELKNCQIKTLDQLRKGDVLSNGAKVVCLVKSKYEGNLVKINNLTITPYHPVFFEDKWQFPIEIYLEKKVKKIDSETACCVSLMENCKPISVCNIVLDRKHYANIEGLNCITLGHGYKDDKVLKHAYYGSRKCIEDLMTFKEWNDGLINMKNFDVIRDSSGCVQSIANIQTD